MDRKHIHLPANVGEHIADKVASGLGSWRFVITQNWLVIVWVTWNCMPGVPHFDPFPFILLNLFFSWQASNTGPVLQMTSNTAAARDKKRDDLESDEVQSLFDNHLLLLKINEQQLTILKLLQEAKPTKTR